MIKNLAIQTLAFIGIFLLISWFKEIDLLDASGEVKAPKFNLTSAINGQYFSSDELSGKPTILYFWAPWCTVCKLSMPNLQSFYEEYKEKYNIVSIALSYENKREVTDYLNDKEYSFPTLLGNNQLSQQYKIKAFPTYYVIDEEGFVVGKSLGYSTEVGMIIRSFNL